MKQTKKNKYPSTIENSLDLHGFSTTEALFAVEHFLCEAQKKNQKRVSIITGKGNRSALKPVLKPAIQDYLVQNNFSFRDAKLQEGGSGAFVVSFDHL